MRSPIPILLSLTWLYQASATSVQQVARCALLAARFPDATLPQDNSTSSPYYTERTSFWSWTEWLEPTCVFLPNSTQQVSEAVIIFTDYDCPFAIRGGGHSAIRGAANIDDGIMVNMKRIRDLDFSPDNKTITIGMGYTWAEVYEIVEPLGYMVPGGRFAGVGTGLALGAGVSYFANERGLTIDNVVNHRVVLANGTVMEANEHTNNDLHWALRGGSNNFGVVTHITLPAIPHQGMHGGRVTYPPNTVDALTNLTYEYQVRTSVEAPDTHVLSTYVYDGESNVTYGFTPVVYQRNATQMPPSLQPWLDIEHSNSTVRNRTYGDLARELVAGFPNGLVQTHYSLTVYPSLEYFRFLRERFSEFCAGFSHIEGFAGLHTLMAITPAAIAKAGRNNPIGLNRARPDTTLTVLYLGLQFNNEEDIDEVFPDWDIFIRTMEAEAKLQDVLFPYIMLTYSDDNQEVIASYGEENVSRLQAIQQKYDPSLVFQRLVTGGQKIPLR
ncbi:FAD-binding oxidoreductase [Aspergillus lucknowensis]|uniref:FAD-binding PCMH-type domain-containing protein n=1 Tax=Aspergillus lucknowensis TaxID=176173 RepID=A0ABR4LWY5_9EURO